MYFFTNFDFLLLFSVYSIMLHICKKNNFNSLARAYYYNIVIGNGKIVWKHGPFCWYFRLNLKYLGWPYRAYIKTAKNGDFCEELLSENDFEAVLATFCCYDHGAKASEAVQKIATDQKEYRKCSSCVIICWIAKIYLAINQSSNSEKWLVTRIDTQHS